MRRAVVSVALLAVVIGTGLVRPLPASADQQSGPPNGGDKWAYCNLRVLPNTTKELAGMWMRCTYGGGNLNSVITETGTWINNWSFPHAVNAGMCDAGATAPCSRTTSGITGYVDRYGNGSVEARWTGALTGNGSPLGNCTSTGITISGSNKGCLALGLTVTEGSGYPSWPTQWWTADPTGDTDSPTATCSRVLAQNNGANVGTFFTTVTNTTPNGDDTYAWVFGDAGTATTDDPQHVYPALASMPAGGWTATVTVTRTATAGHSLRPNGTATATATCSLRVDFLNPDDSEAGSTDVDDGDDDDCPAGFGWLNPLAIGRILKCLLIPTDDPTGGLGEAYEGSLVALLVTPLTVLDDVWGAVQGGYSDGLTGDDGEVYYGCEGPTVELPVGDQGVDLFPMTACDPPQETLALLVLGFMKLVVYLGAGFVVVRALTGAFGAERVV